ncbi:P-loop NTPase family protein [Candidatus Nitrospira nitrificans]|uniref:DUF1611 domain-containing protein n=1 Tax=Candidatus Nitrospira nitrificans TaxID=1742973 RepID=A0A0S4LF14_9BACT|nr:hypothetical protein [Candidatus Nitrospira nitrificans]CUS34507.1 conserved hypothetical protein [Candidatus Nitrospira nitrificans]
MVQSNWSKTAKWASCLRTIRRDEVGRFEQRMPRAGDVVVCRVEVAAFPHSVIEDTSGRLQSLFPGDILLTTVANRESTRWNVGKIPEDDVYKAGRQLSILSVQGIIGELTETACDHQEYETRVSVLGVAIRDNYLTVNISDYALTPLEYGGPTQLPLTILITGSSAEAGKTTAAINIMRRLIREGHSVTALKATGTASMIEREIYADAGASRVIDPIDFGLATTYYAPSDGDLIKSRFLGCLYYISKLNCSSLIVECGGDPIGANVPLFLTALRECGGPQFHVSSASDCLAALGLKALFQTINLQVNLFCGRCTDTTLLKNRTMILTGIPALNLATDADNEALSAMIRKLTGANHPEENR